MLAIYEATFFRDRLSLSEFDGRVSIVCSVLRRLVVAPQARGLVLPASCLKGQPGLRQGQVITATSSRRMLNSCRSCVVSSQNSLDSVDDFLLEVKLSSEDTCTMCERFTLNAMPDMQRRDCRAAKDC
jgi:hypothetical protein